MTTIQKLLVVGGSGFVGSKICETAISCGLRVVSLSRTGRPKRNGAWVGAVEWKQGSAFDISAVKEALQDVQAVITTVGGFGSQETMIKVCGEANIAIARAAKQSPQVSRFVFLSAQNFPILSDSILSGYYHGKKMAEEEIINSFGAENCALLRPAMIFGLRQVGQIAIPLNLLGAPMACLFKNIPIQSPFFSPPVSVEKVWILSIKSLVRRKSNDLCNARQKLTSTNLF